MTLAYGGQTVQIVTQSVTVPNRPQMGTITVHKTDNETGKPVTEAAAVFEIHAQTDIVTGDGTVRYQAGELVDTITTANGSAHQQAPVSRYVYRDRKDSPGGIRAEPGAARRLRSAMAVRAMRFDGRN